MKNQLKYTILGAVIGSLLGPALVFGARTAAPVLTGLFTSSTLSIALTPPTISLGSNGTTTGSVTAGTVAFAVTALDGVGESVPGNAVATSSVNTAHGYIISWSPVVGATSYRIYFATSTGSVTSGYVQYFTATTSSQFAFTSTSSPTYIPAGIPSSNSAYAVNLLANGVSWLNGGAVLVGTTTAKTNMSLTVATTTASTSAYIGAQNASGGRIIMVDSTTGKTTCTELSTAAGAVNAKAITCP